MQHATFEGSIPGHRSSRRGSLDIHSGDWLMSGLPWINHNRGCGSNGTCHSSWSAFGSVQLQVGDILEYTCNRVCGALCSSVSNMREFTNSSEFARVRSDYGGCNWAPVREPVAQLAQPQDRFIRDYHPGFHMEEARQADREVMVYIAFDAGLIRLESVRLIGEYSRIPS